jgi:hypothetical protein
MKQKFILLISFLTIIISCDNNQNKNIYFISDKSEYMIEHIVAAEQDSINMFSDFAIIDSFVIIAYSQSDTLLRVYEKLDFSKCLFAGLNGRGPKDIIYPVFANKSVDYDTVIIYEISTHRIKKMQIDENNKFSDFKAEFLSGIIPRMLEFNMTKTYIIGEDISCNKIFIYKKDNKNIKFIDYFPESDIEYDDFNLNILYACSLVVNEDKDCICSGLLNINCINFFNLQGDLKKTIIVGDQLFFPKADPHIMDFPGEKKYFDHVCGTTEYIYCLFRNQTFDDIADYVSIFIFNWEGEHITTIKTNGNIRRIAVDKDNKYMLGIKEICSDIVKIPLEGVLKKIN